MAGVFQMTIPLGAVRLHPHWFFESLAYLVGFRLYLRDRKHKGDFLPCGTRVWIIAAAITGAAIGSKLLYWLEDPVQTLGRWNDLVYMMGGKSIVGGLLGGVVAVEWIKPRLGVARRTGDLFTIPLAVGIAIGRIGCFLAGLDDHTYGTATSLPWGVDFGDGIPRHPTQIYEMLFLLLLAWWLNRVHTQPHPEGARFRAFLAAYLGFRFAVDFLKPDVSLGGLTSIQWLCAASLVVYLPDIVEIAAPKETPAHE
jgi:phosphatidylglycerol---prolipoprotein diacylglyceryl transferase